MLDYIEKLRAKPERAKKRIAFFTSAAFALIIFIVWFTVIFPDFKNGEAEKKIATEKISTPASNFSAAVFEGFAQIKKGFDGIKSAVGSFGTTSATYYVQNEPNTAPYGPDKSQNMMEITP